MSEFSHAGDKCQLCGRNDFLPLRCDLCQVLLCTEHMAPFAHDCKGRPQDQGSQSRPAKVGLGEALAANMAEVRGRFDGQEWSSREHYRIKQSGPPDSSTVEENRFLKAWRQKMEQGTMSDKNKRMSAQVRSMLLKTKATGRTSLHPDDRFYLEVRFGAMGEGQDPSLDYMYVSRLWTAGRALDEMNFKHSSALEAAYGKVPAGQYGLLCLRTGCMVPLTRILQDLSDTSDLINCDTVVVLPYEPPPPPSQPEGSSTTTTTTAVVPTVPEQEEGGASTLPSQEATETEPPVATSSSGSSNEAVGGVSLVVQMGKDSFSINFSPEEWTNSTVMDLKIRIEQATKVPRAKQKLLHKGILADGEKLASSKLKHGAKVMLMGGGK